MLERLREDIRKLERPAGLEAGGAWPIGIAAIDVALGGGLLHDALHEIAAVSEAHMPATTGFVLGFLSRSLPSKTIVWAAEDMSRVESGIPFGSGVDEFGLRPERLLLVNAASRRDFFWTMEEALRCPAISAVIGEMRHENVDAVALRRLSLAALERRVMVLLLRSKPSVQPSTAATRWVIGAARSKPQYGPGAPRFEARLTRNRRGHLGSWLLEWKRKDECFVLASTHSQPMAASSAYRQVKAFARSVA